jgi:hypothetical protein
MQQRPFGRVGFVVQTGVSPDVLLPEVLVRTDITCGDDMRCTGICEAARERNAVW